MIIVLALGLGLGLGLRNTQAASIKRGAVTSVARECARIGTYVYINFSKYCLPMAYIFFLLFLHHIEIF